MNNVNWNRYKTGARNLCIYLTVFKCVLNHSLVLNRTLSFTFQTTVPGSNPLQDNVRTCLPTQEISERLSIIYPTMQSDW